VVRRSITWSDGEYLWVLDVTLSSPMPWYVGGIANISAKVALRLASQGGQLGLVLRVVGADGAELASRFLGILSDDQQELSEELQLVVSPLYFTVSAGYTSRFDLRAVLEGYVGSRVYNATVDFPVLVTSPRSRVSLSISINGRPDYNYIVESIARVNISVLLRNAGTSYVNWVHLTFYINGTVVDRVSLGRVGPLELREVPTTVLDYFRAGVYYVRVVAVYYLQEGVVEEAKAFGLLEVVKASSVVLNVDKPVVVEGTRVTFSGAITPPPKAGQVVLERLVDGLWVSMGVATIDPQGSFSFQWVAEDVPPGQDYVTHVFRVRVPLSLVGGVANLYSPSVSVQVFSLKTVVRFIADVSLDVVPSTVVRGLSTSFHVRIRPQMPLCIPVKVVYRDPELYEWVELGEVVVCGGEGVSEIGVGLPPGRYPVKAVIPSRLERVESLPKALTVVATPRLLVEAKELLLYGEPLEVRVRVDPAPDVATWGQLVVLANGSQLLSREISVEGGHSTVDLGRVATVGELNITACVPAYGITVCNSTTVRVVKPSIAISPPSVTAEVGTQVSFTIVVSPGQVYPVRVVVLQDSTVVSSYSTETNELGVVRLSVSAPTRPGKYSVVAEVQGTGITSSAVLNVIEVIRSISLELLNRTVEPSATVLAKVSVHPPPVSPVQVVLLIQANGTWEPIAYGVIVSGGEGVLRFQAPSREGRYGVKARIEVAQVESNVDVLQVSARILIAREYLYALVVAAAVAGGTLLLVGRRR